MSLTSVASGTQTASINTEHTLTTQTVPGVFVLGIDLGNMVSGDEVEIRISTKIKSGGTSRLAFFGSFLNNQVCPNVYSIPVSTDTEIKATLKQIAGTGRDFDWNLMKM